MKPTLFLLLSLASSFCHGQQTALPDTTIELRLQLIEASASGQLALSVWVINHSPHDLYIPSINKIFNVHLYQQTDSGWDELDFYTRRRYIKGDSTPHNLQGNLDIRVFDNEITNNYKDTMSQYYSSQKAIVDTFFRLNPNAERMAKMFPPLFIKAEQQLLIWFFPLDHLKKNPGTYKMSYATEKRDDRNIHGSNEDIARKLPEKVLQYTRYIPGPIPSNTVYYSTIIPAPSLPNHGNLATKLCGNILNI